MEKSIKDTSADIGEAERKNDFSKGSIRRTILRLALPITIAQLINILYSVVDRIYLGHMPGAEHLALTGVGLTMPIIHIILSTASLCSSGGSPLFSIARGKGDDDEAERILGNCFTMLVIAGILMTALVLIFKRPILYLFGASDVTYPYAGDYLTIYALGTFFVMAGLGLNSFINSQGFPKTGMMTIALGAAVNLILDPIFIFWLNMGVRGAALATIIAQFCSAVWVLRFLTGKKAILRLKLSCMRLKASRIRKILTLGLAGFCMNITTSLTQIVCNVTLQTFGGDLYIGIMAVINSLREVIFMPVQGILNGATPVIGYNYGAKKYDRVRQSIRFSTALTVSYATVMWLVFMLIPEALIRIFNNEPELLQAGVPAFRIYFVMFSFMSLQFAGQTVFVGLGRSKNAIFFSLLRKAFLATPLTLILPRLGLGISGVFIAEAISQLLGGILCFGTMYLVVYRKLAVPTPANQ